MMPDDPHAELKRHRLTPEMTYDFHECCKTVTPSWHLHGNFHTLVGTKQGGRGIGSALIAPRRVCMSATVSIVLWASTALIVSAVLVGIAVVVNWRTRIVDMDKGEIDTTALRRWLTDYEIALQRRLDEGRPEKR
jgi:hypothetical protein